MSDAAPRASKGDLAQVLTTAGVVMADTVVAECQRSVVPVELVCTVLEKESAVRLPDGTISYGNNVYGHDVGACMSVSGLVWVTPENYAAYQACLTERNPDDPRRPDGRNGVGPMQITHWSLQQRADDLGRLEGKGCWSADINLRVGIEHLAALLRAPSTASEAEATGKPVEWVVFRRYNGKPSYADDAMVRLSRWQRIVQEATMPVLVVQMGHVGRPPCPGSVGTAGEQEFTRRAADACLRLLDGKGGWRVKVIDADPNYSAVSKLGGNPDYYRGDAFVAIHCDGSTNTARDGASFGFRNAEGNALAQAIKAAYLRRTGRSASWLEPDNYTSNLSGYYGTGLAVSVGNKRAVIFETGFLTNPTDKAMLTGPDGPNLVALAIGDALGIPADDQPAPTPEDDMLTPDDGNTRWAYRRSNGEVVTRSVADWLGVIDEKLEILSNRTVVASLDPKVVEELKTTIREAKTDADADAAFKATERALRAVFEDAASADPAT